MSVKNYFRLVLVTALILLIAIPIFRGPINNETEECSPTQHSAETNTPTIYCGVNPRPFESLYPDKPRNDNEARVVYDGNRPIWQLTTDILKHI